MIHELKSFCSIKKKLVLKKMFVFYLTITIIYYVCTVTASIIWVFVRGNFRGRFPSRHFHGKDHGSWSIL